MWQSGTAMKTASACSWTMLASSIRHKLIIYMPVPKHVCAAAMTLAVGIVFAATTFCVVVIATWEHTDNAAVTLGAALACACFARLVYGRYRVRLARQRRRAYTLPYIQYVGGTDL